MNIFFNQLYIHYDCTVNSTIWNKKYLPIHYNVAWYIFSTMVALKPRGLTWQNHTPTHTFPVSTEMFFLMAIICLKISISTICNWVLLRSSACPVCSWHLFLFGYFIFPCCTLAVERLVDNIVEELGLVGVDVVARVGNHLQLDLDPENRCHGDCHAGRALSSEQWAPYANNSTVTILASELLSEFLNQLLNLKQHS